MTTYTPTETELKAHLGSLYNDLAIHQMARQAKLNAADRRADELAIAETRVAIAWVEHLLQVPGTCRGQYRHLLPAN